MINDCGAKVLVTDRIHFDRIKDVLVNCNSLESIVFTDVEGEGLLNICCGNVGLVSFSSSEGFSESNFEFPVVGEDDIASIVYTSGSTGFPKGVTLSHLNMVSAADSIIEYLGNTVDDVIFCVLPLSSFFVLRLD